MLTRTLVADVLDAAGEPDMADRVDSKPLTVPGWLGGVSLSHLRAARRAAARGDHARAAALATTLLDAWASTDEPVASLRELRGLVNAGHLAGAGG